MTRGAPAPPAPPIETTAMMMMGYCRGAPTKKKPESVEVISSRSGTMTRRAPAPAPTTRKSMMMMRYCHDAPTTKPKPEPVEEVADTGSWSPPSTDSSSEEDEAASAASPASSSSHQLTTTMMRPYYPAVRQMPRVVSVRQVWDGNLAEELALIESLLPRFRYVAVDTEFPGTVYRPAGPAYLLTAEKRYALLKANVDELDVIQLGLTLFDGGGPRGAAAVWEFNFREFDVRRHRHAPESIALLRAKGVDFDRTRREGVRAAAFGARLRKWLRAGAGLGRAGVVTFSGGYDLAYLLKVMFGSGFKLPASAPEFEAVVKALLRRRNLFDVKEMARRCPGDLRGGLECVAGKLDVARVVGEAHQAGSDSLLTCHTFMKMKERYFDDDEKLTRVAGMLTDITAF